MEKDIEELNIKLELKRKEFVKRFVFSAIGILVFYMFLYYFFDFDLIVYVNLVSVCVTLYLYQFISKFNFDFKTLSSFGLYSFAFYIYLNTLFFWESNPLNYLFFFPFPLASFILNGFRSMLYWSVLILILSISAPLVAYFLFSIKIFHDFFYVNLKTNFSEAQILIINISIVFWTLYLIAFLLFYYVTFEKIKNKIKIQLAINKSSLAINNNIPDINHNEEAKSNNGEIEIKKSSISTITTELSDEQKTDSSVKDSNIPITPPIEHSDKAEANTEKFEELYYEIVRYFKEKKPYRNANFNIHKLAIELGSNNTYIARALHQKDGKTFKSFVNNHRIKEIIEKLHKGEHRKYTIKHIYTDSGFTSQSTFNRVFKEVEGITPSEYIENLKKLKS